MKRVLHLTTHLNIGGITSYIKLITKEMRKKDYQFYVLSSGGSQEKTLDEQGVTCFNLNIRTKSEVSLKVFLAIQPLLHIIKTHHIDLLHAHTRVTQMLVWWVQRFIDIPCVTTCHGFYKTRIGRRLIPAWGQSVIAISKPVAESLKNDFRVSPDKIHTIFNAIDIEELKKRYQKKEPALIRKELNIPDGCKVLGIVARVVEDKGHEYFLRAAQNLFTGRFPDIRLLVVGEGPFIKKMKKLVKQLNLENVVIFLGNVQDVTYALSVIDIFVLPAIWREGFGLSIIEAMAVCKPVIVTNIWSLNELVQNRINGLLVEPKDTQDLASAIEELLSNNELLTNVAHNGCKTVEREFSILEMASQVDRLYQQMTFPAQSAGPASKKESANKA